MDAQRYRLACRRDMLLLLLLMGAILAIVWPWEAWGALGGGLTTALLFGFLVALLREAEEVAPRSEHPRPSTLWLAALLPVGALPATLLLARAAWLLLHSLALAALVALLALGWQGWLTMWALESAPKETEE